jgi:hypothetical protein
VTTQVEKTIEVDVPVNIAYNQWTQFADFPQFMSGVDEVRQISDSMTHWIAQIGGIRREWDAAILEQVPDSKIAWAATTGATNAGAVYFQPLGSARTLVRLNLEYEPEGIVEKVGEFLNVVQRQAEGDLERFKQFIESRGSATGGWRGAVNEPGTVGSPGVEAASASRGDSGKAGVSGTAVAAGAAAAGAAVVGAAAATAAQRSGEEESQSGRESEIGGDVVAVEPGGDTESALHASRQEEPVATNPLGGDRVLDDDLAATGNLAGDPVAVDESGTAIAGVDVEGARPVDPRVSGPGTTRTPDPLDPRDGPDPQRSV